MNNSSRSPNPSFYLILVLSAALLYFVYHAVKQETAFFEPGGARHIPARNIPVPSTVSPEMQEVIGRPLNPLAFLTPSTTAEWKAIVNKIDTLAKEHVLPRFKQLFPAAIEGHPVGGVNAYLIHPESGTKQDEGILLIGLHGGGYMLFGGEAVLPESLATAHYTGFDVLAIDYRMAPDHPYPAALDDVLTVYREVIKTHDPQKIGIFGTSAGGSLLLSAVLKMHEEGLPLPKVASIGTPWSDLSDSSDSYFTNQDIDNVVIAYSGLAEGMARQYAGSYDLKDPAVSPVYASYPAEFPPSILITGTRDLFLSNTVRMMRKLREAGVHAELQVFEGCSHAFYIEVVDSPESQAAFEEIALFLRRHLSP